MTNVTKHDEHTSFDVLDTLAASAPVGPSAVATDDSSPFVRPRTNRQSGRTLQTVLIWLGAAIATAIVVAALVFQMHGGRWFIVETPSMGTTAPVGTLVLTTPVKVQDLRVGDIITFHPPTETSATYTHRIVGIGAKGISTRGDINGATDPWALGQTALIGKATTIVPVVGWLVRALPILIVGTAFVLVATRLVRNAARRVSCRILGFSLLASLTVYVLKPFVGLVVLTTMSTTHGAQAEIVSTGILPISVTVPGAKALHLVAGKVGTLTVPTASNNGHYAISSGLDLSLPQWILFGAICAIPLLWTLIVGLPNEPIVENEEEAAATPIAAGSVLGTVENA